MRWQVKTDQGEIDLNPDDLLSQLMGKVQSTQKADVQVLSSSLCEFLSYKNSLHEISLIQLVYIAMQIGYFYKVFLEKNKVDIDYESNVTAQTSGEPIG